MAASSIVLTSSAFGVGNLFFQLPIAGQAPAYKERVYCYELYHQMRLRWPEDCAFTLNGEVDKAGHMILRQIRADRYKPDFLVHIPGLMARNFAIIEVKPCNARAREIRKDLRTLMLFTHSVGYERAIYLVYGGTKAFVLGFSQNLKAQLGDMGVQIQVVLPGATATPFWAASGLPVEHLPKEIVMSADDMVDAALAGLDQSEFVTIPSLSQAADWEAYERARQALMPNLSKKAAAERFGVRASR